MNHFTYDSYKGYRSRLDDMYLIHEFLLEIPIQLGLKNVMPPFVLPYYNGVVPDDCGISAFIFLAGGHLTIHTFSFREVFFVDMVYPRPFDIELLVRTLNNTFPADNVYHDCVTRGEKNGAHSTIPIDEEQDFGPHLMLDFEYFEKPIKFDRLFELFDQIPYKIGMTPIMRPYIIKNRYEEETVTSVMTMIAESHISFHLYNESKKAYLDLFSCSFFDRNVVNSELRNCFNGKVTNTYFISRGSKYKKFRNEAASQIINAQSWLQNIVK